MHRKSLAIHETLGHKESMASGYGNPRLPMSLLSLASAGYRQSLPGTRRGLRSYLKIN